MMTTTSIVDLQDLF